MTSSRCFVTSSALLRVLLKYKNVTVNLDKCGDKIQIPILILDICTQNTNHSFLTRGKRWKNKCNQTMSAVRWRIRWRFHHVLLETLLHVKHKKLLLKVLVTFRKNKVFGMRIIFLFKSRWQVKAWKHGTSDSGISLIMGHGFSVCF